MFDSAALNALMNKNCETPYRLAKELAVSQSTVKNWLCGNNTPQLAKLGALAKHYDVPQDTFFKEG